MGWILRQGVLLLPGLNSSSREFPIHECNLQQIAVIKRSVLGARLPSTVNVLSNRFGKVISRDFPRA